MLSGLTMLCAAALAAAPEPVARWDFDGPQSGRWVGGDGKPADGPRPPLFPHLAAGNRAVSLAGGYLRVTEEAAGGKLRFEQGDTVSLSAWVDPSEVPAGANVYVVGKGRTGRKGFEADNQNYALRLTGRGGTARVSFLFRSRPEGGKPGEYHRWMSDEGFTPGDWHHVAVSYTFGKPDSLRGTLDGRPVAGTWDMGGASERPPVVDGDDIVIGSALNGAASNTFRGALDAVVVGRGALDVAAVAREARREVEVVARTPPPADRVRVELCHTGVPTAEQWPAQALAAAETYHAPAFGLARVPHRYIDTGVRADRPNPYLVRASAVVTLPAGSHRLLLRGRGASRLSVGGAVVLATPFPPAESGGHTPIPTDYLDLGPTFRFAPPGNREKWVSHRFAGGPIEVTLETIVGGRKGKDRKVLQRQELGETVAAWSPEGSDSWRLLTPVGPAVDYSDAGWAGYAAAEEARLAALDAANRRAAFRRNAPYWEERREFARKHLAQTPDVPVPQLRAGFPANNAIDHFIAEKLAAAVPTTVAAGGPDFHREVKPILAARCFSCHAGQKVRGGLRMDTLDGLLAGGDTGEAAVVPGSPEKSSLISRVITDDNEEVMPPQGERLSATEVAVLRRWVAAGATWPQHDGGPVRLTPLADDMTFLRRVTFDTVGVMPTPAEVADFSRDGAPGKRERAVERLLADPRLADHWTADWLDALAENPNILNPTLNNTGPFRWWVREALADNKPLDVMATELIRMRGSHYQGGPAGFAAASENDAPLAEKATIIAGSLLGVQAKCARCHDAPSHRSLQRDLFGLAAMLNEKPLKVPTTSSVPVDKLHARGRKPLIAVTLKPGTDVEPAWSFSDLCPTDALPPLTGTGPRDQLAGLVTAPANERFAQVMANRVWRRLMGRGIVEPADDWEKGTPTHPELLRWLGRELVRSGYDARHVARLVINSHAYQRAADPQLAEAGTLFAAPVRRRLSAEQVVDALHAAAGLPINCEEISLDIDGVREQKNSISLGVPSRAWQLASTSNERDRPSLALPKVQGLTDVLEAFGWRGSRQDPRSSRETSPDALQPAVLANGAMAAQLTRLTDAHAVTQLALQDAPPAELVRRLYLRVLTREPSPTELAAAVEHLTPGYDNRVVANPPAPPATPRKPPRYVSWSNHLTEEANTIKVEREAEERRGPTPTAKLSPDWRERMEDVFWSLCCAPEFVFYP